MPYAKAFNAARPRRTLLSGTCSNTMRFWQFWRSSVRHGASLVGDTAKVKLLEEQNVTSVVREAASYLYSCKNNLPLCKGTWPRVWPQDNSVFWVSSVYKFMTVNLWDSTYGNYFTLPSRAANSSARARAKIISTGPTSTLFSGREGLFVPFMIRGQGNWSINVVCSSCLKMAPYCRIKQYERGWPFNIW